MVGVKGCGAPPRAGAVKHGRACQTAWHGLQAKRGRHWGGRLAQAGPCGRAPCCFCSGVLRLNAKQGTAAAQVVSIWHRERAGTERPPLTGAEEVERPVELLHERDEEHCVAHGQLAGGDALRQQGRKRSGMHRYRQAAGVVGNPGAACACGPGTSGPGAAPPRGASRGPLQVLQARVAWPSSIRYQRYCGGGTRRMRAACMLRPPPSPSATWVQTRRPAAMPA